MQLQPDTVEPDSHRVHYLKLEHWPTITLNHFFLQLYFELQGVSLEREKAFVLSSLNAWPSQALYAKMQAQRLLLSVPTPGPS